MPDRLSPVAQAVLDELRDTTVDGDCLLLPLTHDMPGTARARLIDHFDHVVTELQAAGYRVKTGTVAKPDGTALTVELTEPRGTLQPPPTNEDTT